MSSSAVAPVSSGVVSSIKSLPGKLGSVASKVGSKISPLVHKVADSKAVSWGGEQVRKVVVPDQVIRGWQDVYKGFKTLERGSKTIHTVKIIRDPGTLTGSRVVGGAGKVGAGVGKAAGGAGSGSGVANGASSAGKAVKAVKAAGGAKSAASGVAKGGDLLLREGTKISATAGKVKIPGGFREITKVDVTKAEFIGKGAKAAKAAKGAAEAGGAGAKSGLKIVRGAKFRLGGSGNAESLGKGMSKVAGRGGGVGGGAGAGAGELVGETAKGAGKGAAAAKLAKGAKAAKGAKGATGAAKLAKGAKGAAGKGGNVIIEETRTTVSNAAKGFRKPFGISAIKAGLKNIFQGAMKAAKVSGIVSFAISLVQNGYAVVSGQIGLPEAMGSIVRDTAAGFVAGGFAAVFSGGVLAIAGGLGLTAGLPIFLLGLGASLLGFTICNALFNAILGDRLKGLVERLFGG